MPTGPPDPLAPAWPQPWSGIAYRVPWQWRKRPDEMWAEWVRRITPLVGSCPWEELPRDLRPTPWHLLLTPDTIEGDHPDILTRGRSRWLGETLGMPSPESDDPADLLWHRWFRRTIGAAEWDRDYEQDWRAAMKGILSRRMAEEASGRA